MARKLASEIICGLLPILLFVALLLISELFSSRLKLFAGKPSEELLWGRLFEAWLALTVG